MSMHEDDPSPLVRAANSRVELAGWGGWPRTGALHRRPVTERAVLAEPPPRGVIARGLGRAYNDAACNAGGAVDDLTGLAGVEWFDATTGQVAVRGGTSLADLLAVTLPAGWFLPVTPGTRFVTVGGAIAADAHGKNHAADGSFCDHVDTFELRTPDGATHTVSRDSDVTLFDATAGGLGLTGAVLSATLRLLPVRTDHVRARHWRAVDLDAVVAGVGDGARAHRYAIGWLDLAPGRRGRGYVGVGDHAEPDDLDTDARHPVPPAGPRLRAPSWVPSGLLSRSSARVLGEFWYRRAPARPTSRLEPLDAFFYPLDAVDRWDRFYGRRGLTQYQCVVPSGAEDTLAAIAARLAATRCPSLLATLKRMRAGRGLLSFPIEGWALALDIPRGVDGLARLLGDFDELVAAAGGRVYLAKDARLPAAMLPRMYPELEQWRAVRRRVDPDGVLRSDLARRLEL